MDTRKVQLHLKQFPLKEIQKIHEPYLQIGQIRNTHIKTGLTTILPGDCGDQQKPPHLLLLACSKSPVLTLEGASVPQFCSCCPRDGSPDLQACIQEVHRTTAKKAAVLNGQNPPSSYAPGPSPEEAGKNIHLLVYPRKKLNYVYSQLLSEGPSFNPPACKCWLWSSTSGPSQILAHPQLLGGTMNKEGGLDNHKALRDSQKSSQAEWQGSSPTWDHSLKTGRGKVVSYHA